MKDVRSKYHTEGSLSMKKNENKYTPYVKDGSGVANQIITEKLEKKFAFSWFGFFLGPVYYFYRRCYAAGTVLLLISLAGSIAGSLGRHGEVLSLLGFLLGGFCFYPVSKTDTAAGKRRDKLDRRVDHGRRSRSRSITLRKRHSSVLHDVHGRAVRRGCR